jgi:hypothetical protein
MFMYVVCDGATNKFIENVILCLRKLFYRTWVYIVKVKEN